MHKFKASKVNILLPFSSVHIKHADSAGVLILTTVCGLNDSVENIKTTLASSANLPPDSITLSYLGECLHYKIYHLVV